MKSRAELFHEGLLHIERWCALNHVRMPEIESYPGKDPDFGVCAYYRDSVIRIWVDACAPIGRSARAWSYPGYVVDRTPYGVLAHELGHHVEDARGARGGLVAKVWLIETAEDPISGYCPNPNEWFAEIFRLFVTNPSLLELLRPKMYKRLRTRWLELAETRSWQEVLAGADRWITAAQNKIRKAQRGQREGISGRAIRIYQNPEFDFH